MAAEGATLTDDAHISFAKRLAHNNKDTRKAALKKVKRWLVTKSKQGALDHDEIIKIWKGLHYSMWYSDKPLTQESLALDISQIVSLLPDMGDAINFFGGFCETIAREWAGIDRQRLDKFYMFIKTALKCVLEFCAANDWKEEIVKNVVETLDIRIINSQCPDSISVFISEHLYTLYTEVCTDSTSPFFITELLSCYVTVLSKTPKKDLSQVLMSNLFTPIISNSVNVKIDHSRLIDHITNVAVQPGILTRNRKLLYRLRNDVATVGGVNVVISSPLGKHSLVKEGDENVPDNGISEEETVKPPKKKKKKKKKQVVEQSETVVENGDIKTEEISEVAEQIVDSKPSTKTEEEKCEPVPVTPDVTKPASPEENESSVKVEEGATVDTKVDTSNESVSVEDSVAIEEPIATKEAVSVEETDVKEESESPKEETKSVPIEDISADSKEDVVIVEEPESTEKEEASEEQEDEKVEEEKKEEEKKEEVAETESKEEVTEEATDKETKEEVDIQKETLDNKEDLVEEAAETEVTAQPVLAPTESEISEEVVKTEEVKSKEIISSTPATKTGKRKSTRTKKTPKKVAEAEPAPASEPTESVENEKPAEETEPEVSSLPEETTEAAPSPKQTRSLRKRKKKSICATPEVTAPSTPTVSTSTKKKVRLSMENNQTFFFKKNTSLESPKPYDSTRTPVKGVLKVSPALTRSQARKKGKSRVKP